MKSCTFAAEGAEERSLRSGLKDCGIVVVISVWASVRIADKKAFDSILCCSVG